MTFEVVELTATEILDSRGRPTVAVRAELSGGAEGTSAVPSGASTGSGEAVELRDGDPARYGGMGVKTVVGNVMGELAGALRGQRFEDLAALDATLVRLDGTMDKSRLGANAIVGVSMAVARALAHSLGSSLWELLRPEDVVPCLPVPHFNVINGGVHAPNDLDFQEFMVAPLGAPSEAEAVRAGAEVYVALRARLSGAGLATGLGDEGGFAPEISEPERVLSLLVDAIGDAGYRVGRAGVAIALDPAASEFYHQGRYHVAGEALSADDLIGRYEQMVDDFPIWSIEDGLAEGDWEGWEELTQRLGERVQLVGDDIFVTNPSIITAAAQRGVANAALIKPNQIGTVTETLEAMRACRQVGYTQMVSHRSGETDDTFIAELAVASGCGQIKSGAPARGERVAKYNRLMAIEAGSDLPYSRSERP
ncbi:MAG: phosphopyruvate hydratase [Acidimicrobiales bacterium]